MGRATGEFAKRLVPATDEEIIALAEKLWADPELRAIFERVGHHGDLRDDEELAIGAAIDACRQGHLWNRDALHLALAPCLLRQLAAGIIDRLDCPQTKAFLSDRRVVRIGPGMKPVHATAQEVMNYTRALRNDPRAWAIAVAFAARRQPDLFIKEIDREGDLYLGKFERKYIHKYGLFNRGTVGGVSLLLDLAAGTIPSLDSPEAWRAIRTNRFIRD
jgi:hypothetical protein